MADVMTFLIVMLTPGIFGYLIWELKENWRLFAANRSKTLDPVLVGSHGESLPRLLRPGLHSGTMPKRFAKLRRAERKAAVAGGDPRAVRKHREVLHHVETDLRRYIQREFVAWFSESRGWPLPAPQVEEIRLATNAIARRSSRCPAPSRVRSSWRSSLADGGRNSTSPERFAARAFRTRPGTVLRPAIVNVLKTGGVEVLVPRRQRGDSADDAVNRQEIGSFYVPWSEWIATWETDRDVPGCTGRRGPAFRDDDGNGLRMPSC